MNITKRKVIDSVLKNHKPFFIKIGIYRDISVQVRQLFAHFRPVKFWLRDLVPLSSVCTKTAKLCSNFNFSRQVVFEL